MQPRPISIIVFGILNIGFGAFALLEMFFYEVLQSMEGKVGPNSPLHSFFKDPGQLHTLWVTGLISGIAGLPLIAAGVGLLLAKNWGRVTSIGWAIFNVLFVVALLPLSWKYAHLTATSSVSSPEMAAGFTTVVVAFGTLLSLAYPVTLLIFMTRPKVVAACKATPGQP